MDHLSSEGSDESSVRITVAVALWEAGRWRDVGAYAGETLMIALRRAGLPLAAICGGKGACGTCKIALRPDSAARLAEPAKGEMRLLAHLNAREGERLSCRITLSAELAGLEVEACDEQESANLEKDQL